MGMCKNRGRLSVKKILWDLFYAFARIGLFTFGGGYAMLALIQD